MSKGTRWLVLAAGLILLLAFAQTAGADEPPGAKLYSTYCSACHGAGGKNGFAAAIGSDEYLASHDPQAMADVTAQGLPSKGMPAWAKSRGGPLSDDQIAEIIAYLRAPASASSVQTAPAPAASDSSDSAVYTQTRMTVTQSRAKEGGMVVTAALHTFDGAAAVGLPIHFERVTQWGNLDLGTFKTDASGQVSVLLREVPDAGREVQATFNGNPGYGSSAGKIVMQRLAVANYSGIPDLGRVQLSLGDELLLAPEGSLITPNPPLLPTALFALVVACVWLMYGYVVYQVVRILTSGTRKRKENTFRVRAR